MADTNEALFDAANRHQTFLIRYGASSSNEIIKMLNAAESDLIARIAGRIDRLGPAARSTLGSKRLQAILKDVRAQTRDLMNALHAVTRGSFVALSMQEIDIAARRLNEAVGVDLNNFRPAPEELRTLVDKRAVGGRTLRQWFTRLGVDRLGRLESAVNLGVIEGDTMADMVRRLRAAEDVTRRSARTMVRTHVNHVANQAREALYAANSDIVDLVRWTSTLDGRTSSICKARDGKTYPLDDGPRPPAHPNAVVRGTKITTKRGLINVEDVLVGDLVLTHAGRYKRVYTVMSKPSDTQTVELQHDQGSFIRVSEDHPVLTRHKGWVNAGDVKAGDVLFHSRKKFPQLPRCVGSHAPFVEQSVLLDSHNLESSVREELISYGIFSCTAGVSSAINLKSKSVKQKINDVVSDGNLKSVIQSERVEKTNKSFFMECGLFSKRVSQTLSDCFAYFGIERGVLPLHAFRRLFVVGGMNFWPFGRPVIFAGGLGNEFCIGPDGISFVPNGDAVPFANVAKCSFPDVKFALDQTYGFPKIPVLLKNKFFGFFFGHCGSSVEWRCATVTRIADVVNEEMVFNLAVENDETYVADGIVVHNCRSIMTPVLKSWESLAKPGALKPGRGAADIDRLFKKNLKKQGFKPDQVAAIKRNTRASMNGQVPGDLSYGDWLRRQPAGFQNETLGPVKAKLFREGGLSLDRFVEEPTGRGLTLDQIKRRNETTWMKIAT